MIETNKSGTSLKSAISIATALGVSLDYLAGWIDDPRPARELLVQLNAKEAALHDIEEGQAVEPTPSNEEERFHMSIREIESSTGAEASADNDGVRTTLQFSVRWLRERGLRPSSCRMIRMRGESMEPTLPNGSVILVDLATEHPKAGRIFVIRTGDGLIVKRLARNTKVGWMLESDHPQRSLWPTQPWPEDGEIVGEVRWVGRSLP